MEKFLPISLKLNFTPNTLVCYGLTNPRISSWIYLKLTSPKLYHVRLQDTSREAKYWADSSSIARAIRSSDARASLHLFATFVQKLSLNVLMDSRFRDISLWRHVGPWVSYHGNQLVLFTDTNSESVSFMSQKSDEFTGKQSKNALCITRKITDLNLFQRWNFRARFLQSTRFFLPQITSTLTLASVYFLC